MTDRSTLLAVLLLAACSDDPRATLGDAPNAPDTVETSDTAAPPEDTVVAPGLALVGLTPAEGRTSGLDEIALTGRELSRVVEVRFGDAVALDPFAVNDGLLVALTPPHARGLVDVTVIDDRGATATLPLAYKYFEPVAVVTVEPREGDRLGGERVRVYGSGFTPDAVVLFGGRAALDTRVIDANTLEVTTPDADTAGSVDVHVSCEAGVGRLRRGFEYTGTPLPTSPSLEVTRVTPDRGPATGGTAVVIEGRGFTPGVAVRVGALPATGVTLESATRLRAITGRGSPGPADVRLIASGAMAESKAAFVYDGPAALWTLTPPEGSVAGGTRVTLNGAGFPTTGPVEVLFGGTPAQNVVVVSEREITAVTPPGAVGLTPVVLQAPALPGGGLKHPAGFVYFDPAANPGTWGEPVDGSVNITVQEARSGERIPGAFVMLGDDLRTPFQGTTDANGQITFSGPNLRGDQTVTASRASYQTFQLAGFDAENVTVPLERAPTCSDLDDMPCEQFTEPPPVVFVKATLIDRAKAPTIPFGECRDWQDAPLGLCAPCASDADCSATTADTGLGDTPEVGATGLCRELGSEGAFCTVACDVDSDCGSGFVCLDPTGADRERRCVPPPGTEVTYCDVTESAYTDDDSITYPGVYVGPSGVVEFASHPGDFAVFCWSGLDVRGDFRPRMLGVTRNLSAFEDGARVETEVRLDIPLSQRVTLEVDRPTFGQVNQELTALRVFLDLGGDGVLEFPPRRAFTNRSFVLQVPAALTGDLYDARWNLYAEVSVPPLNGGSATYEQGLTRLDLALDYRLEDGAWRPIASPPQTTRGLARWRDSDGTSTVIAVGEKGRVLKAYASTWAHMPSDTDRELLAVATADGTPTTAAIAVGLGGLALHWNGLRWEARPTGTTATLEAVDFADSTTAYAVAGRAILRWDGSTWAPVFTAAAPLHAVLAQGDTVWAAGDGLLVRGVADTFETLPSPTNAPLRALAETAEGLFAAGDGGTMLSFDGLTWNREQTPTAYDLLALATDGAELVAVGARATILRRKAGVWQDETPDATRGTLRAAVGDGTHLWAMGSHEFVIGPLLGIPEDFSPAPGGFLDTTLSWKARPGREADFTVIESGTDIGPCSACGMMFTIPHTEWRSVLDGDLFRANFPALSALFGQVPLSRGTKFLTFMRVSTGEDFDFDHTTATGFYGGQWRAWAWRTEAWIH